MAEKRYYWLKLWKQWWEGENIREIRAQENGAIYVCIFIDMLMLALNSKTPGVLLQKNGLPYNDTILAKRINADIDHLRFALVLFEKLGMVEMARDGTIYLPDMIAYKMIGSKTEAAIRMARYRQRKALQLPEFSKKKEKNEKKEKEEFR